MPPDAPGAAARHPTDHPKSRFRIPPCLQDRPGRLAPRGLEFSDARAVELKSADRGTKFYCGDFDRSGSVSSE